MRKYTAVYDDKVCTLVLTLRPACCVLRALLCGAYYMEHDIATVTMYADVSVSCVAVTTFAVQGNRLMPQCGYSGTLVNILQSLSVPFETVDVLADERIRQGIKASERKKERKRGPERTRALLLLFGLVFSMSVAVLYPPRRPNGLFAGGRADVFGPQPSESNQTPTKSQHGTYTPTPPSIDKDLFLSNMSTGTFSVHLSRLFHALSWPIVASFGKSS